MSRMIHIGFRRSEEADSEDIEIQPPYYLFGTQNASREFWSAPIWKQIGVTQLARLSVEDPVNFIGWEMLAQLEREIELFRANLHLIDASPHLKATWLAHLVYSHGLLRTTAPASAIPEFSIG